MLLMAVATLVLPPGRQAKKRVVTRIATVQFGDGYMERRNDGLNNIYEEWDVTIPGRTNSEADALEVELAQYAVNPFYWHPLNATPTKKYRIDGGIQRTYHSAPPIASTVFASKFQTIEPCASSANDLSFKLVEVFEV